MIRTATCACGQLSLRCEGEPAKVSLCHCPACQKRTGSTYGLAAFFARGDVQRTGTMQTFTRPSDSGYDVAFHFCPTCGSTVFWEPGRKPDIVAVAVGSFADPAFPPPSQAVHEEHRHPWVVISN
ncbi:MAG: GFA family protein [Pseudomonadota bacterium]